MTAKLMRVRRALAISNVLVVSMIGTAWAGCPSVDVERCERMHDDWHECQAAKDALHSSSS